MNRQNFSKEDKIKKIQNKNNRLHHNEHLLPIQRYLTTINRQAIVRENIGIIHIPDKGLACRIYK